MMYMSALKLKSIIKQNITINITLCLNNYLNRNTKVACLFKKWHTLDLIQWCHEIVTICIFTVMFLSFLWVCPFCVLFLVFFLFYLYNFWSLLVLTPLLAHYLVSLSNVPVLLLMFPAVIVFMLLVFFVSILLFIYLFNKSGFILLCVPHVCLHLGPTTTDHDRNCSNFLLKFIIQLESHTVTRTYSYSCCSARKALSLPQVRLTE